MMLQVTPKRFTYQHLLGFIYQLTILLNLKAQINYDQICNVFHLCNRIEPFAALFWVLCIVLAHTLQQVIQSAIPQAWYWHTVLYVRQGSVRFNLMEEVSPPPFSFLAVLILCLKDLHTSFQFGNARRITYKLEVVGNTQEIYKLACSVFNT